MQLLHHSIIFISTSDIAVVHNVHNSCMDLRDAHAGKYLKSRICMYVTQYILNITIICFNYPCICALMKNVQNYSGRATKLKVL